jgi:hypothetical protein
MSRRRQSRWAFWKFVHKRNPIECWPWFGALSADGHPRFGAEGTQWWAHRLAYESAHGEIGPWNFNNEVMHLCGNARCCNPAHLKLGTRAENLAQEGAAGKLSRIGTRNGNSRLSIEQVEAIRKDTRSSRVVAAEYGLEKTQVLRIRRGAQWKYME